MTGTVEAAGSVYWTPARMAAALTALRYPPATQNVWKTVCVGIAPRHDGMFAAFRCTVTYIGHTRRTVWAKPLNTGRICGSTVSLRACKPLASGPLAGDPTVCSVNRPADCAQAAAKNAVIAKHGMQVNLVCTQAATIYAWTCTPTSGTYTVTFTKGAAAWTTAVTP